MTDSSVHHKTATAASTSLSYPVRRMRNTAVLVKWIEEHQSNPYPTKAEKQYLAYYSGMNLTQLSTWFANARRRIKKIGMKTWLEGRSTFSLDYIPSSLQRSSLSSDSYGSAYHGLSSAATSPYAAAAAAAASYSPLATAGFHSTYPHQHSGSLGMTGTSHIHNGMSSYDTTTAIQPSSASASPLGGLYGMSAASQCRNSMMTFPGMSGLSTMGQWPTTPILSSNHASFSSFQSRPSSNSTGPLHSPLTAQVYSADSTGTNQLRTHSAQNIDVGETTYALQQQSPEPLLPECASTEPVNASV